VVHVLGEITANGGLNIQYEWGEEGWLPAAAIRMGKEREDGTVEIEVPDWLREDKKLPAAGEARQAQMRFASNGSVPASTMPMVYMEHCDPRYDPPPVEPDGRHTTADRALDETEPGGQGGPGGSFKPSAENSQ
jgi:hypothetical protein